MEYIHGTVAAELRRANSYGELFGTPEQDRRFRQQMANIHVELSSFHFDKIGSLYQDEKTSEFYVGPELETGKGPWNVSLDYYNDLANHAIEVVIDESSLWKSDSISIPVLFKHLIVLYGQSNKGGPFYLLHSNDPTWLVSI